jgi:DNA polymerase-3 subunit gamma/tau
VSAARRCTAATAPLLRRRRRAGARRPDPAQRHRARQGPPRLPLRGLARDGQDVDGEDPRPSLNCERGGPTITPCGVCESCRSIAGATSLDVIEMDAASNNSVDDIRDLRESVSYARLRPSQGLHPRRSAHADNQAWNAFLKTLEEPPPNTIFVLATTEANKILPTVVDRCHRFDFLPPRRAGDRPGAAPGRRAEGIEIGDEAVRPDRPHATGSFRDALGTLEQLVAYSAVGTGRRSSSRRLPCSARPTRTPVRRGGRRGVGRRARPLLAPPGCGLGRTSRAFSQTSRPTRAADWSSQTLGERCPESVASPQTGRPPARAGPASAPSTSCGLSTCSPRAPAGRRTARTPAPSSSSRSSRRRSPPSRPPPARCCRASSGSRRSSRRAARRSGRPGPRGLRRAVAPRSGGAGHRRRAGRPRRRGGDRRSGPGRTSVAVSAQVADQPAVATSTTLPGTPPRPDGAAAAALAGGAAQKVSAELATPEDPQPAVPPSRSGPLRADPGAGRGALGGGPRPPGLRAAVARRARVRGRGVADCSPRRWPRPAPRPSPDQELTLAWGRPRPSPSARRRTARTRSSSPAPSAR